MSSPTMRPPADEIPGDPIAGVPQRIGRYHVLRRIGAGGMGVVYSAYDEELNRRVAIKLLHAGMRGEQHSAGQARLLREAQAMARVSHPNVAQVHDVGLVHGQVFIAMELVHGQTLRTWLAQRARSWREIVEVYAQAARGLVAAHAKGIIHRDFKPDNALVGDDGRVRVLDFSLARTVADPVEDATTDPELIRDPTLTHVGKVIGTPAYMPPEQALGALVDERADQFSFCVALFEALFGRRPFHGDTIGELLADVARDRATPPRDHGLPAWLVRAVLRGIKPAPDERWPSMQELLAELERDRGRWLRVAAVVAVAAALVGLVLLAVELRARWERSARDQAAAARLAVLETSLDRDLAVGARVDAEAALAAFTDAPEHRDTPALAAAFLGWSRRMQVAGDAHAARTAAAQSYAVATDDAGSEAALEQLAALFVWGGAWESVALLVADLRAHRPALLASPRWIGILADAARIRRDFAGFAAAVASPGTGLAELAPLAAALSHGTATLRDARVAVAVERAGAPAIALFARHSGEGGFVVVGREPTLPALSRETDGPWAIGAFGHQAPRLAANSPSLLFGFRPDPEPTAAVFELTPAGLRERLQIPTARPLTATVADLDGDGDPAIYVGTGPYARTLLALTPDASGELVVSHPHPGTDASHSDINALLAADLDGDGRDELVAAAGPWSAYDVRVFRAGPTPPALTLVARRKFGNVAALAAVPGPEGRTRVVAAKIDHYPSRIVFPPDRTSGEPAGLYVLELQGDEIVVVAHHPWPRPAGKRVGLTGMDVGDLDGDGRLDVVAGLSLGETDAPLLVVFHQRADRSFVALDIAGVAPLLVDQFDADPAAELLARVEPEDPAGLAALWVLGAGDQPVPPLALPPSEPPTEPAAADPLLARAWLRAEELGGLGLFAEAAQTIAELASLTRDPDAAAAARLRAADLYRRADNCDRATPLYAESAARPAALQGLMACHAREGRFADALAAAEALLARPDAGPGARAAAEDLATRVRPGLARPGVALRFDGPLDPRWHIDDPTALRQDPISGSLGVDALVRHGELATFPLECDPHALSLAVDLTIDRMEWASGFEIGVRPAGPPAAPNVLGVRMMARGGGGILDRSLLCVGPDGAHNLEIRLDLPPGTAASYRLEVGYFPALHSLVCSLTGADGVRRSQAFTVRTPIPAGACAVSLRSRDEQADSTFWARVHLRRLEVGGVDAAPPSPAAVATPARLLVEGEAHAALLALAAEPGDDPLHRVWQVLALADLGRWPQAAELLRSTPLAPDSPARLALLGLLRTRAASFGPLARGALGDGAFRLHAEAFVGVLRNHADDPLVQRALTEPLSDPSEYEPEPGDRKGFELRGLFHLYRARMWLASGALDRAEAALLAGIADLERQGEVPAASVPTPIRPALLRPALAAARGDLERARREIRASLDRDPAPEILLDLMRLRPALRALLDEPKP